MTIKMTDNGGIEIISNKKEQFINLDSYKEIKGKNIFRIKESSKTLVVVRLDVAESILRRKPKGIFLEKLEID